MKEPNESKNTRYRLKLISDDLVFKETFHRFCFTISCGFASLPSLYKENYMFPYIYLT